jgi:ribosomal protein L17
MSEKLPIKSVVEAERAQTTLKRAERDKEEAEQTIKGLKKVIETNQNQFSIQMKKYDKQIQQLVVE